MKKFKPLRDLVLVEKVEEEKVILMPEQSGSHFVKLKVLAVGPEVKELLKLGEIVWAENLLEQIAPGQNQYLILSKYLVGYEEAA